MVDFKMNDNEENGGVDADNIKINPRDFFVPTQVIKSSFQARDALLVIFWKD